MKRRQTKRAHNQKLQENKTVNFHLQLKNWQIVKMQTFKSEKNKNFSTEYAFKSLGQSNLHLLLFTVFTNVMKSRRVSTLTTKRTKKSFSGKTASATVV